MRPKQKHFRFDAPAKPVFAGFMAFLLLLAVLFSVSPLLHKTLHVGSNANSHLCLACSLVHGQVNAAEVAPVSPVVAPGFPLGSLLPDLSPALGLDYRLSPSRAPPARASILSVVA